MRTALLVTLLLATAAATTAASAATPGYGTRSQVGHLTRVLDRRDAGKPATPARPSLLRRQPLVQKLVSFLRPGWSVKDDVRRIDRFIEEAEQRFGAPISTLEHPALVDGRRMRAEKALALLRFDRRPEEVTETFIRTQAKVTGTAIAPRDVFVQRWRPIGAPSGKVIVMAPGFLQTGRNFYEQVQLLNAAGHDVVVMDQQWAGYSADAQRGVQKGAIDRGFGIARDVADAAAYGNELLEKTYGAHPHKQLILVGTSMGGGPGVLGALAMYDAGRLDVGAGRSIPKDRGYVLQGAFLGRTRSIINDTLNALGTVPGVRGLPLPAMGVPLLNDDPRTNAKLADHAVAEDIRGRAQAFRAALPDIATTMASIETRGAPSGKGYFIHSAGDHLASMSIAKGLATDMQRMGSVTFREIPGRDHVIEETPGEQRDLLAAIRAVSN